MERLEREGLQPSAEADRATLIRRASFDLRLELAFVPCAARVFRGDSALLIPRREHFEKN